MTPPASTQLDDADVFSRGSLKLTYDLLRKQSPTLALQVRNISHGVTINFDVLSNTNTNTNTNTNKNTDHFRVNLEPLQVRAIVEGLMSYSQINLAGSQEAGLAIMAKALLQDWLALAEKMMTELSPERTS